MNEESIYVRLGRRQIDNEKNEMIKYRIFKNRIEIGLLEINEEGKHRYTPIEEQTEYVKQACRPFWELYTRSDWREPISFFQNRINDAKRFDQEKDITNHTDDFRLYMVEEQDAEYF